MGAYGDLALPIRRDPSLGIAGRTHKRESELIQSGTSAAAGATGSRRITPSNRLLGFTPLAYPFPKRTHEAAWLLNHSWGLVRRHQGAMHAYVWGPTSSANLEVWPGTSRYPVTICHRRGYVLAERDWQTALLFAKLQRAVLAGGES